MINGPEAFTPDNEFCLGETEVRGLFVAAGFCAHGLAGAGGIGKVMADGSRTVNPRSTFGAWTSAASGRSSGRPRSRWLGPRDVRDLLRHPLPAPRAPGRPAAAPPPRLHQHRDHGAAFGEKSGWERVNWYERNFAAGDESLRPRGWAGRHWSPAIGAEHRACREAAALFDETRSRSSRWPVPARRHSSRACARTRSRARWDGSPTARC